jgi:hypothetical protein
MSAGLLGKINLRIKQPTGFVLVEILLSMALAVVMVSVSVIGMQSSQDLVLDAEMSKQAELKASTELENSLVNISVDYNNFDNKMIQDGVYTISSNIDQGTVTLCGKNISSTASWTGSGNRDLQFKLSTRVLDSQMVWAYLTALPLLLLAHGQRLLLITAPV